MRLGDLAGEPSVQPDQEPTTRWYLWFIFSGLFAASGIAALLLQSGPVICTSDTQRACIIERVADAELLGPPWRTVDTDVRALALPSLERAHWVALAKVDSQVAVDGWTQDGLHVTRLNVRVTHSVNAVDAITVLQAGGAATTKRKTLVEHVIRHTTRHTLSQLPVAKLIGPSPDRRIHRALNGPLGDALAQLGVQLRTLTVFGTQVDGSVASIVERIRASHTRINNAEEALITKRKAHRDALAAEEARKVQLLVQLREKFSPQLRTAEQRLRTRTRNANLAFEERHQFAKLKREVEQIRLEALAAAARQNASALDERVKALAEAGPQLLDLEIADRVMGRIGAEQTEFKAEKAASQAKQREGQQR